MSGGASSSQQQNQYAPQLTPQQLVDLYNNNLPQTASTVGGTAGGLDTALAQGAAAANPIFTQAGLGQLNTLAPGYQQAGANLATQQAGSTLGLLNGVGSSVANSAAALNNSLNPVQGASNTQAQNLINSINLNGLSGGEQAATERSLNQSNYATGNLGLDNATNAVSNAMNFGNALQAKRTALGTALGVGTGVASAQNQQFNPVNTAIGSGSTASNFGLSTFNPTQGNGLTTTPTTFGTAFLNPVAANASASAGTGSSSSGSGYGGVACYLTTACCRWKGLPDDCEELTILRAFRDECVPKSLVREYYAIQDRLEALINNKAEFLSYIWSQVTECVTLIKACHRIDALNKYVAMTNYLKGRL
jgi:hypothetical protein